MATVEFVPNQHATEGVTAHVIWMTAGLSCDGDSVAMTSAKNPSLEDIIRGIIPGMPRVVVHTPVLAYENGAEFFEAWYQAERGELDPFVLILEGSLPNEEINGEGHFAAMGVNPETGQPITTNEWVDRLAPKAAAVVAVGTCATYGGIPAMRNNPTGAMGLPDYLGWNWKSKAGIPIVCIPGCPAQPDNTTETLLYLVLQLGGMAPMIDPRRGAPPALALRSHRTRGVQPRGFTEQGQFATQYGDDPRCLVKLGCKGPVVKCNVPLRGWQSGMGVAPTSAGSAWRARCPASRTSSCRSWTPTRGDWPRTPRSTLYGPLLKYFRHRNLDQKYDKEPGGRRARSQLGTGYKPKPLQLTVEPRGGERWRRSRRPVNSRRSWSRRCPGIRSRGSSAAWASTRRSTLRTTKS